MPRFIQEHFAIGFWVEPPADARMVERYKEIADANFTLVIGGFHAREPKTIKKQLALCRKFNLGLLIHCPDTKPENLPAGPACWGYALRDEPNASDFPALRAQVDALRAARPGKLGYINLFPDYASDKQLGTPTYEEHVARFVQEVEPDVLSMDHYPLFKPNADGRDAYRANLEVMRKYSLQNGIPFWNFFNTMPFGPHTDPTEGQLRWQIYTSLAYGAKGVLYFCYYTPLSPEFPKGGAIITRDDRRTRHWYQAQRINGELKCLGPTLMQLTSLGVYRVRPDDDPAAVLAGTPIKNLVRADYDPPCDYLAGVFQHADGRRVVLLNNYQFAYTAWPTVEFDADASQVLEVNKESGKLMPVVDDSPDLEGLQISLDAGDGRLFVLPSNQ
ncbi:MAG: beta-galactosidase [Candidatus Hydrogenedentes bacterium]|nr:beta-galactosidase [Candidatus Hydrogenedentota bacterium]